MTKSVQFKNDPVGKFRDLADAIKNNTVRDGAVITEKEVNASYNSHLPEGVTPDTVKAISKYNSQYLKASTLAVGELAAEAFLEDKSLQSVTATIGFQAPGDAYKFSVDRSREFPVPRAKGEDPSTPQKKVTKHLHIERTVEITGQSIKSVSSVMSEEFKDRFAS